MTPHLLVGRLEGSASVVVDAPAADVFAVLTDVERLPEWNAHIRRVLEPPAGPPAEGADWVVLMAASGTTWNSRARTLRYDPDTHHFAHVSRTDDGNPSWAGWCWQVTDVPGGGSRLDVTWDINPRTFWRRALFARLRRAQLADEVPRSLTALARLVPAVRS